MRAVRSKDTLPELAVRRLAHGLGYRYRLHASALPGKPDLTFASRRKVIFVHGCFWHQHPAAKCSDARQPRSNTDYWQPKLANNVKRDAAHIARLTAMGWKSMVVWECETKQLQALGKRLVRFLGKRATLSSSSSELGPEWTCVVGDRETVAHG